MIVANGSATPSPVPGTGGGYPSPSPTGFLSLAPTATPTGTPTVTCTPGGIDFQTISGATAVASATSAVVTWHDPGDNGLVEYRLTAISQDVVPGSQRDIGWVTVKPAARFPRWVR